MINELPHYLAKINVAHILWARRSPGRQLVSQLGRRHLAVLSLGRLSAVKASELPSPRRIINRSYFSSRLKYQNVIADSDQQAATICSCRTRCCHMPHVCVYVLLATLVHHAALDDRVTDFASDCNSASACATESKSESE